MFLSDQYLIPDYTRYFGNKQEIKRADPLGDSQHLQEQIIEKSKALIIVHNRIVQEEAKYNYLKNSLVTLTQNQSLDTLPRPHITRYSQLLGSALHHFKSSFFLSRSD